MDTRQVEEQLALRLASSVYSDSPGQLLLKSVTVTRQDLAALLSAWNSVNAKALPLATLRVVRSNDESDAATFASGSMGLGVRQFMKASIWVVAGSIVDAVPSPPPFLAVGNITGDDVHGSKGMLGNLLAGAIGVQAGQGVDRVAAELVRQALGNGQIIDSQFGFQGRVTSRGDVVPVHGVQIAARRIDLEITNGSTVESFHAPTRVHATVAGSNVTLAWTPPPSRPDFLGLYQIKRDGAQIALAPGPSSYLDAGVPSGVHSYSVAALYDDAHRPPTDWNRQSAPVLLPVTV